MKQDILIFSSRIDSSQSVYAALAEHDIPAIIITDKHELLPMLYARTPAFLWLDLNTNEARLFLTEIMDRTLHPPPYIILTSKFLRTQDADPGYGCPSCLANGRERSLRKMEHSLCGCISSRGDQYMC